MKVIIVRITFKIVIFDTFCNTFFFLFQDTDASKRWCSWLGLSSHRVSCTWSAYKVYSCRRTAMQVNTIETRRSKLEHSLAIASSWFFRRSTFCGSPLRSHNHAGPVRWTLYGRPSHGSSCRGRCLDSGRPLYGNQSWRVGLAVRRCFVGLSASLRHIKFVF